SVLPARSAPEVRIPARQAWRGRVTSTVARLIAARRPGMVGGSAGVQNCAPPTTRFRRASGGKSARVAPLAGAFAESNVPFDPNEVAASGAVGVRLQSRGVANLVQQPNGRMLSDRERRVRARFAATIQRGLSRVRYFTSPRKCGEIIRLRCLVR